MISDVLFKAIKKIREYQLDWDTYDDVVEEVNDVVRPMIKLQAKLDSPPETSDDVWKAAAEEQIKEEEAKVAEAIKKHKQ